MTKAAEFLIEWHCLEDADCLGPRMKSNIYCAECAVFYRMKDDRFIHVKLFLKEIKKEHT